jgi:hypothetical protein
MKIRILLGMFFSLAALTVAGCGGGGGGAATTTVAGTAMKGLFTEGTVTVFAVDPATGNKAATPLKTDVLKADSTYSVDIGATTGPVIIEVTGKYKDEASGPTAPPVTLPAPIRAAVNAAGSTTAMVTPLTELAVVKVGNVFTKTSIDKANADITAAFKLDSSGGNILTTTPVDAATAAAKTAAGAERDYGLLLASVSQIMKKSGGTLSQVLSDLAGGISGSTLTLAAVTSIKVAQFDFVSSANNQTTLTVAGLAANPFNAGNPKVALLKVSTAGLPAGGTIGGIDFTINLPAGVIVSADATTKEATAGAVTVSGVAVADATSTSISLASFNAPAMRIVLANAKGFGAGQFMNVASTLPTGSTVTPAQLQAAVTAATGTATDLTGAPITGVTLTAAGTDTVVIF